MRPPTLTTLMKFVAIQRFVRHEQPTPISQSLRDTKRKRQQTSRLYNASRMGTKRMSALSLPLATFTVWHTTQLHQYTGWTLLTPPAWNNQGTGMGQSNRRWLFVSIPSSSTSGATQCHQRSLSTGAKAAVRETLCSGARAEWLTTTIAPSTMMTTMRTPT